MWLLAAPENVWRSLLAGCGWDVDAPTMFHASDPWCPRLPHEPKQRIEKDTVEILHLIAWPSRLCITPPSSHRSTRPCHGAACLLTFTMMSAILPGLTILASLPIMMSFSDWANQGSMDVDALLQESAKEQNLCGLALYFLEAARVMKDAAKRENPAGGQRSAFYALGRLDNKHSRRCVCHGRHGVGCKTCEPATHASFQPGVDHPAMTRPVPHTSVTLGLAGFGGEQRNGSQAFTQPGRAPWPSSLMVTFFSSLREAAFRSSCWAFSSQGPPRLESVLDLLVC